MILRAASVRQPFIAGGYAVPLTKYRIGTVWTSSGWTPVNGATLADTVDEVTPNDSDYNQSAINPVADVLELGFLNVQAPPSNDNAAMFYRVCGATGSEQATVSLIAGDGSTIIKSVFHNPLPTILTTFAMSLSPSECAALVAAGAPGARIRITAS